MVAVSHVLMLGRVAPTGGTEVHVFGGFALTGVVLCNETWNRLALVMKIPLGPSQHELESYYNGTGFQPYVKE